VIYQLPSAVARHQNVEVVIVGFGLSLSISYLAAIMVVVQDAAAIP